MTISTMDIPFSSDMDGKEGLSALGYSRKCRRANFEQWQSEKDSECSVTFTKSEDWYCEGKSEFKYPLPLNHDELLACAKRIEELEAGDES